jgi:DNA-binding NtrC family response regulator
MPLTVLIADDEPAARYALKRALARLDCELLEAADGTEALAVLRERHPDLVFLDLTMPGLDGLGVLREAGTTEYPGEIVMVTADDRIETAIECVRLGAADYITKPYEIERLRAIVRRNLRRIRTERQVGELQAQLEDTVSCGELLGVGPAMQQLFGRIRRAAPAPLDILIRGETGTGKELVARELHRLSGRDGPFVAVNTAALSESLAESQLFGHVRGAFTGAERSHQGVFEQAHGGTLFLDEIGDMPLALQAKVLRALQERAIQPVGSTRTQPVDVRVISATHQDLSQAIADGRFREDLFFRLHGFELTVPSLRERPEDILPLARRFLEQLDGGPDRRLGEGVAARLLSHHWPGNVRELRQVIRAAAVMAEGEWITPADLGLDRTAAKPSVEPQPELDGLPLAEAKTRLVEWFERRAIRAALERNDGNISAAARQLGIHRQSLQQKLAQLGMRRDSTDSR